MTAWRTIPGAWRRRGSWARTRRLEGAASSTGAQEVRRDHQQERAVARHHRAPTGDDPRALDQVLQAARRDHARQGPAREGHRPVVGPDGEDGGARPHPARIRPAREGKDARLRRIPNGGAREVGNVGVPRRLEEGGGAGVLLVESGLAGALEPGGELAEVLAARQRVVVEEPDRGAALRRRARGREAGGAGAEDGDVGFPHDPASGPRPLWAATFMPGSAIVMQARTLAWPSITSTHSQHTPMPQ